MKPTTAFHSLSTIIASSMVFTGCMLTEMKKNMDEMHDATVSMNEKMDTTNSGMKETNKGVSETGYTAKTTFLGLRKDSAAKMRIEALNEMIAAGEIKAKLEASTAYMYAMEFQAWDPIMEGQGEREVLFQEALAEFFKKVSEFSGKKKKVSPTQQKEDMKNLYAFVAALHRNNSLQTEKVTGSGYGVISLLDLIADGIDADAAIKAGKMSEQDLKPYQREVTRELQTATYVLRVRHNFLNAYAYVLMDKSDLGDDPGMLEKIWRLTGNSMFGIKWVPNFPAMNLSQINYTRLVVEYSMATRDILTRNGIDAMTSQSIIKLLKNIDWEETYAELDAEAAHSGPIAAQNRKESLDALKAAIEKLIAGSTT